jgi:pimeloyl-ACP methyl ester carboxylesterase
MGAVQSHRLFANGLEHHVLEWAAPASAQAEPRGTALLIHGYMDAAGTWDLVAPALSAAGLRVLAPDMRGYGEAPRTPPGSYYHFADYVPDVADIIEAMVGDSPLFVVGHSMGGTVSTLYAGAFPARVTKLALLEGLGPPDNAAEVAPDRMAKWIADLRALRARAGGRSDRDTGTRDDLFRRLAMNHPRVDAEVLKGRLPHLVRELDDGRVAWRFDPLHKTTSPTPFYAKTFMAFATRVTCPTLFVSGGENGFHPADEEERMRAFGDGHRVELPDAGHMMHWTRPSELGAALVSFWNDHEP